ncbi:unnamed protein product [Malus baccata var. baccata]
MASAAVDLLIGKVGLILESGVPQLAGVGDELQHLMRELLAMKSFLEDTERSGALGEVEETWMETVRDVSIDVQDIIDDFTLHCIATKLHKIIIKAIPERKQLRGVDRSEGGRDCDHSQINIYGESSLFFKDDELVGIKDAKEKLVGWLLSGEPRRTIISVVGMGGSDKTSLVVDTFNGETAKFDCYAWITVSKTYNIEDLSSMSQIQMVELLANYLQPKRYVIVFDDVRVMLTTRREDIASFSFGFGCHVHSVQPLKKNEVWVLFSKKAFSGLDLVGKCKGLPLGIVALGAFMSTKRLASEWTNFYTTFNWELTNNPMLVVVKRILMLSFNGLPYRLKHYYVIECDRLVRLWIAEGFAEKREPYGRAKALTMHHLLQELALSISEVEKFCTVYNKQKTNEDKRAPYRLSVQANYGKQAHRDMSKVPTFFIFAPNMTDSSSVEKLPSDFKLLKVMDLRHVPITKLPDQLVKFYNMKYLNLKGMQVKELPRDIGNLHHLETLDIRHSKIRMLPAEVVKLQNLRHLLMSYYFFDGTKVPQGICKLESLQVCDAIELEGMLVKQLRQLTQLTRMSITNVRESDEEDLCKSLESVKLIEHFFVHTSNEDEVLRLDALPSAPPSLKALGLIGKLEKLPLWSRLTEDFLPYIQALPNSSRLRLNNAYLGNQLVFHSGFPKLSELYIMELPKLNAIILHVFKLVERIRNEGSLDRSKVMHISDIIYHYQTELGWSGERLRSSVQWVVQPSSTPVYLFYQVITLSIFFFIILLSFNIN